MFKLRQFKYSFCRFKQTTLYADIQDVYSIVMQLIYAVMQYLESFILYVVCQCFVCGYKCELLDI